MITVEALHGPIYFGGAVVIDRQIQVAWLQPNIVIAARDPMAGWNALQHSFPAASIVNRFAARRTSGEIE